jgi:hypothetical protein
MTDRPNRIRRAVVSLGVRRRRVLGGLGVVVALVLIALIVIPSGDNNRPNASAGISSTTRGDAIPSTSSDEDGTTTTVSGSTATTNTKATPGGGHATTSTSRPGDLVVEVNVNPASPHQGELAEITVKASSSQALAEVAVDFGDGTSDSTHQKGYFVSCRPGNSSTLPTFTHAWRLAKTYAVVVTVPTCGDSFNGSSKQQASRRTDLTVGPGEPRSNGPKPNGASFDLVGSSAMTIDGAAWAGDEDGWVGSLEVDWGDGSSHSASDRGLSGCDDGGGQRYPDLRASGGADALRMDVRHTYAAGGTYTVTVTSTSTGCDGKSPQTGVHTARFSLPCRQRTQEGNPPSWDCSATGAVATSPTAAATMLSGVSQPW